jgi:hypothetical protein
MWEVRDEDKYNMRFEWSSCAETIIVQDLRFLQWDLVPCSLYTNKRFGETYHFHLQGWISAEQETGLLAHGYKKLLYNPGERNFQKQIWSTNFSAFRIFNTQFNDNDRPCGLVVRVPGYRSRGPNSIPGTTRFSK